MVLSLPLTIPIRFGPSGERDRGELSHGARGPRNGWPPRARFHSR